MGPALSGLDNLLRIPTGCGEQNMVLFAPNIYILQYLKRTQQLTEAIKNKATEFLQIGKILLALYGDCKAGGRF